IADNHRFDRVFLFNEPHAVSQLQKGCTPAELAYNVLPAMFWGDPPLGFNPAAYAIPPVTPQVVEDDHLFDLGNRTLQVIHTPGHTRDCIMLLDTGNRILFTGDSLYKGALYLHFQSPMYGYSDLGAYTDSMKKAARLAASLEFLYCSHNDPVVNPTMLHAVVQALEQIQSANSVDERTDAGLHAYEQEEDHLARYPFGEFSIIIPAAKSRAD
ncbi:MAG: MBL fold metallo-hydrolase, partial [Bacillota bacterium]|nr:MBL fold metallo-hydrolase [Bacillota bacterium]